MWNPCSFIQMPITLHKPIFLLLWLLIPIIWVLISRSFLQGSSQKRQLLVGGLRSGLIILLGFTLADPRLKSHTDQVNLLFCLDVSESISRDAKTAAATFMQQTMIGMDKEDQAGLIIFGKHPSLEVPLKHAFDPLSITSEVNTNFTNLYEALQLAIGNLPQTGRNKIVLFTDGNENVQNALEMAYLAASLGIEISPVPLASWFGKREVFIQDVETPATVSLETPYEIRVVIMSSQENQGELVLLRNDKLLANQKVTLQPGKNVVTLTDTLPESGLYLYKAVINVPDDVFFQNNEGLSFTRGTRKSQILYLADERRGSNPFAEALTMQGLELVPKGVTDLTGSLHDLLEYNAIILDNVSGQSLSYTTMENIETYVKDMGGGLIMIGGDNSFGAGYYNNTPVEKALPVFMDTLTDMTFSGLCLIFVIDKSSSMTTSVAGKSKLEMAKIAAFSSIELLNPTDRVGIIAFDTEFTWIVPITHASERQNIANELSSIREVGGTDMYPALTEVFQVLKQEEASRKHVIVLSDGRTQTADFQSLVQSMRAAGVSLSTVAIGSDADVDLLRSMAEWGNGRSYYTEDPSTIPTIFTGETKIVAKNLLVEKPNQPTLTMRNEILQGIDERDLPTIYGQVETYPKPGASVLLKTPPGPLLAAWQYGLGRSVAFTSDLSGRWGKDWVNWAHYGKFTAQMVKWAQRPETHQNYAATIERKGEQGLFTVDVTDIQNQFVNNLALSTNILFPSKNTQTLALDQIAPGRYRCAFPAEEIGDYYFSLFGTASEDSRRPQVFGFGIPYTEEFTTTDVNRALLERLVSITNGKMLAIENVPHDLFTVQSGVQEYGRPLWKHIALTCLLLLIIDVAVRKILTFG
jgi:uncharacterized membrane protein